MTRRRERLDDLERMLYRAHRARGRIRAGGQWSESVMNDVRRIGRLPRDERDLLAPLAAVAWRFSAAAGLVAVALLVYDLIQGFVDYGELSISFLQDPSVFII